MAARLGELLRDLSGRTDHVLARLVHDQVGAALDGARLATALVLGEVPVSEARQRVAEIQHDGDERRRVLVGRLRRSVTSPIDREDLFRLSRSIDDVLDTLRDFIREAALFGVAAQPACVPVLAALIRGLIELEGAVLLLPRQPRLAAERALRAKKQGLRGEYQHAISRLLETSTRPGQPVTTEVLKSTLLLGRLDAAGSHVAAAADVLADGVVKRFQ